MLEQGQKLKMEVTLGVEFQEHDLMAYNTIAEIPGTDLKHNAVVIAAFVYNSAMRDEKLPRKSMAAK